MSFFGALLHGFMITNVGWNDETSGCNLKMGYKTNLLKHGRADQQCKKHTPISLSRKYAIKFVLAGCNKKIIIIMNNMNNINNMNNNNMEKWVFYPMCQKPCLVFPINLILLGWTLLFLNSIWVALQACKIYVHFSIYPIKLVIVHSIDGFNKFQLDSYYVWTIIVVYDKDLTRHNDIKRMNFQKCDPICENPT